MAKFNVRRHNDDSTKVWIEHIVDDTVAHETLIDSDSPTKVGQAIAYMIDEHKIEIEHETLS